jgi:hypothetical protein
LAAVGASGEGAGGLSAGFSARWQYLTVHYAFSSGGALGSNQQLGVELAFQAGGAAPSAGLLSEDPSEARYERLKPHRTRSARSAAVEAPLPPPPRETATPDPTVAAAPQTPLTPLAQAQDGTVTAAAPSPLATASPSASPTPVPFGRLAEQRLSAALRAGDANGAYEALERLRVREPGLARRLTRAQAEPLVSLARQDKDPEQGYRLLRSALHAAGEDARLLAGMARLCVDQTRQNEARVYVDRAVAVEPGLDAELRPLLTR